MLHFMKSKDAKEYLDILNFVFTLQQESKKMIFISTVEKDSKIKNQIRNIDCEIDFLYVNLIKVEDMANARDVKKRADLLREKVEKVIMEYRDVEGFFIVPGNSKRYKTMLEAYLDTHNIN